MQQWEGLLWVQAGAVQAGAVHAAHGTRGDMPMGDGVLHDCETATARA